MTEVRQSPQTVQNVVTYDVVVSVDNSELALMPGLTAATRTIVDQRTDVLRVPNQALYAIRHRNLGALCPFQAFWKLEHRAESVMSKLAVPHDTWVFIGDGQRALFCAMTVMRGLSI